MDEDATVVALIDGETTDMEMEVWESRNTFKDSIQRRILSNNPSYTEDALTTTALDPRLKNFDFPGAGRLMRADAYNYLRGAYKDDWAPPAPSIAPAPVALASKRTAFNAAPVKKAKLSGIAGMQLLMRTVDQDNMPLFGLAASAPAANGTSVPVPSTTQHSWTPTEVLATQMKEVEYLKLPQRKHEEVSEALEIAAVHRLLAGQASECVLKVPRTFSQWSANNAAKKIGEFLDAAACRAEDDAEGARLQRHVAAKLTDRYQPLAPSGAPCYGPCCRHAVTDVVGDIQEHFSPQLGSCLKSRCKCNDKEYQRMIHGIGQRFDPVKGVHVPRTMSLFDVPFPQLSSNRAVREWRGYAKEELGVEHQVLEGKIVTAAIPIGMAVANRIWDLRWSSGYAPDYAHPPPPPHVHGIVDYASAYMGVKQTTGVTKVVRHDGLHNNSLVGYIPVLMYEGDDAFEVLAEKGKRFFDELNDIAIKGVTLPDGTKGCNCCTALTKHFHMTWEQLQAEGARWRELIWQIKASHSFVKGIVDKAYKCPCCNKMIRKHGDVPPKKTKNGLREFARLHAAQRYLKPPLLHVGAKRKVPDLLHINLRITAGLYYYTVQRHCATPEDLQAPRQWMFDELGITVNSKKRQNRKQDAVSIGQKKESFIGAECVKLIAQYDKALEHVRETYPTVSASDDVKAQTAWEIWKQLWELLLEPVDPARSPGTAHMPPLHLREARAQQVKLVAEKFVQAFVNAAATVYCHILQCHIPDYIRWYGDLLNYGCHGSEHAHSVTKTAYRRGTARHPEFRVGEVFGYMKIHESHQHELPTPERPKRGPRGKKRDAPT
eukprot:jgi/Tetstr1/439272/TSEL_027714.t1